MVGSGDEEKKDEMMDSPQAVQNVTAVFPNIYQTITQEGDDEDDIDQMIDDQKADDQ